ncbi:glutamate 5-kinase [Pendulispora albinea]|uniref:Glutamate 5-kinase n=1 Tax=Pendulispora albinea TaxID=2741071 RepID=A0ABZ2LXW3_9BACT
MAEREPLRQARRVVIKLGSSTLAGDPSVYARLAGAIHGARQEGRSILLVSSGAIALGTRKLGFRARPKEMAKLQAAAAAGQSLLMRAYEEAFGAKNIPVAQVLLTHADLADRVRANNARAALGALLEAGAVPILNENDSVSVEEIKFGDNDQLAAMVTPLADADLLVLLSDVDGLYDDTGTRIPVVDNVADAMRFVRKSPAGVGTGGMTSKLEAARRATLAGADVVVADARREGIIESVLAGEDTGTHFVASRAPLSAKKHWIAFTLRPRGDIVLDPGAAVAVRARGKSVLSVGVLGIRGDFRPGDAVRLLEPDGAEIGRALVRCAAEDAVLVAGKSHDELPEARAPLAELVHRDDMVIWKA